MDSAAEQAEGVSCAHVKHPFLLPFFTKKGMWEWLYFEWKRQAITP